MDILGQFEGEPCQTVGIIWLMELVEGIEDDKDW
jgi:hypothetical protein